MSLITTLHILPGPVYNSEDTIKLKYVELSRFSQGSVVSLGPTEINNQFGNYNIKLTGTNERYNAKSNFKLFLAAMKEAKALKRSKGLDIVICYDPLKTGLISYLIKKIYGCKMIVEVNGVYDSPELYRFKKGFLIKIKRAIYPKIQNFILRSSDGVKCLFKGQVKNDLPVKKQIVRHFFDFTQISKSNYAVNDAPVILSMGYPSYIKGMDVLVTAFNKLADKYPSWKLVIAGYFSPGDREYLQDLAVDKERVSIRKPVEFSKVPELIDHSNIFVLASRTEGIPRVLIEAMARGRARIASTVGGIPAVINDGKDGFLIEPGNVDDLCEKLVKLMDSEPLRQKFCEAGLKRFENEFTITQYTQHIQELYESVCAI